jgi:hypothetical protein
MMNRTTDVPDRGRRHDHFAVRSGAMAYAQRRPRHDRLAGSGQRVPNLLDGVGLAGPDGMGARPKAIGPGGKAPQCVADARFDQYISSITSAHSYVRVTWQPMFCQQGGRWTTGETPALQAMEPAAPLVWASTSKRRAGRARLRPTLAKCATTSPSAPAARACRLRAPAAARPM